MEIYDSVTNDERDKGNIVIRKEDIHDRTFPEWSIGFRHLTAENKNALEGYSAFLDRSMEPEEFANKPDRVLGLLYQFKKGNARPIALVDG